jgi:hypothetical protein
MDPSLPELLILLLKTRLSPFAGKDFKKILSFYCDVYFSLSSIMQLLAICSSRPFALLFGGKHSAMCTVAGVLSDFSRLTPPSGKSPIG